MAGRAALVQRRGGDDGDLVERVQQPAGRGAAARRRCGRSSPLARPTTATTTTSTTYGGVPLGYYLLPWASAMMAFNVRPPDPTIVGDRWRELWHERLDGNVDLAELWLRHQARDDYWRHGSICEDYGAIECPVLAVGGWADAYVDAIFRMLEHLSCPRRALIGPWGHQWPQAGEPGRRGSAFCRRPCGGGTTGSRARTTARWTDRCCAPGCPTRPSDRRPTDDERPGRWIARTQLAGDVGLADAGTSTPGDCKSTATARAKASR